MIFEVYAQAGQISDKLRGLYGGDVATWPAHRASEELPLSTPHDGVRMGRRWDNMEGTS